MTSAKVTPADAIVNALDYIEEVKGGRDSDVWDDLRETLVILQEKHRRTMRTALKDPIDR